MRRVVYAGLGVVVVFVVAALLAIWWIADEDVGTTQVDRASNSDTLIVLIHGLAGPQSIASLKTQLRQRFPTADILTSTYSPSILSNVDPYRLTNTIENGIHDEDQRANYQKIILIGHSLGAVVLRKALVWGLGSEEDRGKFGAAGKRRWADKVVRYVSLAGINRGWSLDQRPDNMPLTRYLLGKVGTSVAKLTGTGGLVLAVQRGAPFIADLRVQWIRLARQDTKLAGPGSIPTSARKLPLSIHLVGDIDDVVSREDSQDLAAAKDARFIPLVNTGHLNLVTELTSGGDASERLRKIMDAVRLPENELQFENLPVAKENRDVERIIYIMHGIRDYGTWGERLRTEIQKRAPSNVAVTPSKYGYFPMLSFILFSDRQRNVRWFMDEYTENLAQYPRAQTFDFIGHSNGTYILASALERYATLNVRNVFFAGSVVPKHYRWRNLIDRGRVGKFHNVVATTDWVVALFPRFFEQIADWKQDYRATGYFDIGSGGFRGFEDSGKADPSRRIVDIKFVSGGHSAALDFQDPAKLNAIVNYALDGSDAGMIAFQNAADPAGWLDMLSNISWIVWLGLAVVLSLIGYAALTFGGKFALAAYLLILAGLLFSF